MIRVDAESFFAIVLVAALAATAVTLLPRRLAPPVVVLELLLGIPITTIAVEAGHMRTSTAAGLVGAAMLSTLIFPFVAAALRKGAGFERRGSPSRCSKAEAGSTRAANST